MTPTLAILAAVMTTSLLGSMHCAGMCGAFLAYAVEPTGKHASHATLQAMYHAGRLVTYLVLGAMAGVVGSLIELGGFAVGIQHLASIVVGAMMVVFGTRLMLGALGVRTWQFPVPKRLAATVGRATRFVADWPAPNRAFAIGTMTTLLPCGWLYLYVATAGSTGHPLKAMLVMVAFWVGTLPVLAAVGIGVKATLGPLRAYLPVATSFLVVLVGILTLSGRLKPVDMTALQNAVDQRDDTSVVLDANDVELPCCDEK